MKFTAILNVNSHLKLIITAANKILDRPTVYCVEFYPPFFYSYEVCKDSFALVCLSLSVCKHATWYVDKMVTRIINPLDFR